MGANTSSFLAGIALASLALFLWLAAMQSLKGKKFIRWTLWGWAFALIISLAWTNRFPGEVAIDNFSLILISCAMFTSCLLLIDHDRTFRKTRLMTADAEKALNVVDERMEQDRQHLIGVLHDEVNPLIILANIEIDGIKLNAAKVEDLAIRQRLLEGCDKTKAHTSAIYSKLREIITNSRHEALYSVGFIDAVGSAISHYQAIFDQPVFSYEHTISHKLTLTEEQARIAYLAIQESMLNIIKHARATKAVVKLELIGSELLIEISDDGDGMNENVNAEGHGIFDMRRRLKKIGSTLKLTKNNEKGGTTIAFSIQNEKPTNQD